MPIPHASRRQWLRLAASGVAVTSSSGWIEALAADAAAHPSRRRACILLWMNGGPSQTDTFDPRPGHENGGPVKSIETSVPGLRIGEHLPKLARQMKHLAIVRSMSTKEGDHGRATYYLRTGYVPQGNVQHPPFGALVAKEVPSLAPDLPGFVSIGPDRTQSPAAYTPGFLGHEYAPLIVGEQRFGQVQANYEALLKVRDLEPPPGVDRKRADARLGLLASAEGAFVSGHPGDSTESHRSAVDRAVKLTRSRSIRAFNLGEEPAALRDAYGRNSFGQGCLLARRLVERGVPFVEVTHAGDEGSNGVGWDTHFKGFEALPKLCGVLDAGWSTLIEDLRNRGLLDSTLIVWMGEFGRTPKINNFVGRDHFPTAWSAVLAGGGIAGGRVIGRTTDDGMRVEERPVSVPDLVSTACMALGIDPRKQNMSNVGRPIRIADPESRPIAEALS
jgi:Protein of unknown function (DUF1501)